MRPWRRRVAWAAAIGSIPLVLVVLLAAVFSPQLWTFYAGLATGCVLTMFACLLETPPEWIQRKRRGRDGERMTEKQLRKLGPDWEAAHDIKSTRGNFDHLVAGPAGVFLLETKRFTGRAEVTNGRLLMRRGDDQRDSWRPFRPIEAGVRQAALEARNRLNPAIGTRWVQGVIVLWCDFPQQIAELDRVVVVHGKHLATWLQDQPGRLDPVAAGRAREHLQALETYEIAQERLSSVV